MLNRLLGVGTHISTFTCGEVDIPSSLTFCCNFFPQWQNGVTSSIRPQQITYIVPGVEKFNHEDIGDFIQKAQDNLVGLA